MSVAILSGYIAESAKKASARVRGHLGIDVELIHPCGDCGTIEHEEELVPKKIGRQNPDQLEFQSTDFRRLIDGDDTPPSCERDAEEMGICPYCNHPDLFEGEICIGLHVPVEVYDKMKIFTKRKGRAFSDDGRLLSSEYCSVIIGKEELHRILLRASLPDIVFE